MPPPSKRARALALGGNHQYGNTFHISAETISITQTQHTPSKSNQAIKINENRRIKRAVAKELLTHFRLAQPTAQHTHNTNQIAFSRKTKIIFGPQLANFFSFFFSFFVFPWIRLNKLVSVLFLVFFACLCVCVCVLRHNNLLFVRLYGGFIA